MKDKTLINEVRKRVSLLEIQYETTTKDLESARGFLAMLEREAVNAMQALGDRTHTDIVADTVVDILSHSQKMHRKHILEEVIERGVHIGNDGNQARQLAGLSSIMSKDTRLEPVEGKGGYWSLVTPVEHELSEGNSDADDTSQEFRSIMNSRLNEEGDELLTFDKREQASRTARFRRDENGGGVQLSPPRAMNRRKSP